VHDVNFEIAPGIEFVTTRKELTKRSTH